MLKKIAVTGAIASGKSTVCHVFRELGAYVVSADQIVHQLLTSASTSQQVIELLGSRIVCDGVIDRKKVADIVFTNPTLLQELERLIHPLVFREIKKEFQKASEKMYSLFVAEVPLLFEAGFHTWFDAIIAVVASKNTRRGRAADDQEFSRRAEMQSTSDDIASKVTFIIENEGTIDALRETVKQLYYQIHP